MHRYLRFFLLVFSLFLASNQSFSQCLTPTGMDTSVCGNGIATLKVSGSTGLFRWYNSAEGQSFLDTGSTFITPSLSLTDSFYVAEFDTGTVNQSLRFDGNNDYIAIQGYFYKGTGYKEVTVEAWIKTTDGNDQFIASYDRSDYWRLEINGFGAGTGQVGFDVRTNSGQLDFGSTSRIDDGLWHHVAGVYDNGAASIYIDGVLDATTVMGSTFGIGSTRYGFIGVGSEADVFNGTNNASDYFNGDMSSVRIWNTARSQAEIQQSMNKCLLGPQIGLQTDFHLNSTGSQDITLDYSGNKFNGELKDFTLPGAWQTNGPSLYSCATCESQRDTVVVEVVKKPANFLGMNTCIASNSYILDAGSNYNSYLWQDNSTLQTFTVLNSGNYSVTVDTTSTYGNDCQGADTIQIFINSKPTGIDTSFCGQKNYQLRATGSNGLYKWYANFNDQIAIDTGKLDFTLTKTDTFYVAGIDTLAKTDALKFNPAATNATAIKNFSYTGANNTELTVEAWIKTTNANDQIIASFDRSDYWRLEINGDGAGLGTIGFDINTNSGVFDFGGTIRIDDGNWHHVAATYNNGLIRIYVDGVIDNSTTNGIKFGSGVTRFGFIGVGSEAGVFDGSVGPVNFFDGEIATFGIWSKALSQTEIQNSMNNCRFGGEDGLELFYNLLEGGGSILSDVTGNNRNGILKNFLLPNAWNKSGPNILGCPSPCESVRDTVIAKLNITPKPDLGVDVCASAPTILDAGTNYSSYLWNTSETTQSITSDENNEGQFYVTVDSTGTPCSGSDTIFTNIILIPDGVDTNRCGPGNVELNATGGADYVWFDKNGKAIGKGASISPFVTTTDTFIVSAIECDTIQEALSFDGADDYVALNMSYNTSGQIPFLTIEAWVKTNFSSSGSTDNWAIVDFDRSDYYNFYVHGDGRVAFSTSPNSGSTNDLYASSSRKVNDGAWHHIAGVYDGTDKFIYIDGELITTLANPHGGRPLGVGSTRFGFIGDGSEATSYNGTRNNFYYQGQVTEVRIWNEARTADEIKANMKFCLDGSEPNLAAYYKTNDGIGSSTLTDYSGNNRNGTLFNMNTSTAWVNSNNDIYCNCCTSDGDTAIASVHDLIDSNRFIVSCPGVDSSIVLLKAFGGTNKYDYRELSSEFSYSTIYVAGQSRRKLKNGGTYNIEISDESGCLDTIANIIVSTSPTTVASNNSTGACRIVDRPEFAYIVNGSNEVIAGVSSSNKDLGNMTATVYIEPTAHTYNGDAYLGRHYVITSDSTVLPITRVRLPLTNTELSSLVDSANFTPQGNDDVSSIADLGVTKYNGPTEDGVYDPSDATSLVFLNQSANGSQFGAQYFDFNTTGFSEFWPHASATNAPLPIELLYFSAEKKAGIVELNWITVSETNNDYFTLERADDKNTFRAIGIIQGAGNSNQQLFYQYLDDEAIRGNTYYRLKQTDFDGKFSYSETKLVKTENNLLIQELKLFPNPANQNLTIKNNFEGIANIKIMNTSGDVIIKKTIKNSSPFIELDVSTLVPGIYFILINNSKIQENGKFVISR